MISNFIKIVAVIVAGFVMFLILTTEGVRDQTLADVIFSGGKVYTLDEANPWAHAVAVKNNKILKVFYEGESPMLHAGPNTKFVNLKGRMLLPGFVDGHTHFNRAGALIQDANLLRISDDEGLKAAIEGVANSLEAGEWITGGLWGAYEAWAQGVEEGAGADTLQNRWRPTKDVIDDISPNNPVFINSFDSELYLANSAALRAANLPLESTGLFEKGAMEIETLKASIKPKSEERLLDESRAALKRLAESGVTEIHDITRDPQMERFVKLEEEDELTARIWMRADLSRAKEFNDRGIKMGTHPIRGEKDAFLRWGAYKGYIDGIMGGHSALFFEPYDDQPDNYGRYRVQTSDDPERLIPNMDKMYGYLLEAHKGGFVANVHAIGTKGTSLMLDTYEQLMEDTGKPLSGYRVIHAQVIRDQDFPRFQKLGVWAEINPYHLSDDMRWMEERIGDRVKWAYAFKSLLDNGADLVFGSDWPGTQAAEYFVYPMYLIHAAVNRTTIEHTPEGGWFPDQKISMEEALRAYTKNGAQAAFDGATRGVIREGYLADMVILDQNLFEIDPKDILKVKVDLTMVDGKIVFERE